MSFFVVCLQDAVTCPLGVAWRPPGGKGLFTGAFLGAFFAAFLGAFFHVLYPPFIRIQHDSISCRSDRTGKPVMSDGFVGIIAVVLTHSCPLEPNFLGASVVPEDYAHRERRPGHIDDACGGREEPAADIDPCVASPFEGR